MTMETPDGSCPQLRRLLRIRGDREAHEACDFPLAVRLALEGVHADFFGYDARLAFANTLRQRPGDGHPGEVARDDDVPDCHRVVQGARVIRQRLAQARANRVEMTGRAALDGSDQVR